jgi:hypothetical protein
MIQPSANPNQPVNRPRPTDSFINSPDRTPLVPATPPPSVTSPEASIPDPTGATEAQTKPALPTPSDEIVTEQASLPETAQPAVDTQPQGKQPSAEPASIVDATLSEIAPR